MIAIKKRYLSEEMKIWLHLKHYLLSLVLFIIAGNLFSQPIANSGYYYKYEFDSFLENKTMSSRDYYREIHRVIKYPSSARAAKSEGIIRVMILNHSENNYEIIAINYIESLSAAALEAVETAHAQFANISGEKYITELTIEFEYQLDAEHRTGKIKSDADVIVITMEPKHKDLIPPLNKRDKQNGT